MKDYEQFVRDTREPNTDLNYLLAALGGEAGEVLNEWKKHLRGDDLPRDASGKPLKGYRANGEVFSLTHLRRERLLAELGDVIWYATAATQELGMTLNELMLLNLAKISARRALLAAKKETVK